MINVFYRLLDEDGNPTEFMGFASAKNGTDLFWLIDEFCDPYSVQLAKCLNFGICIKTKIDDEVGCVNRKRKRLSFLAHSLRQSMKVKDGLSQRLKTMK